MFKRDRKTQGVMVPFGERTKFEFFDSSGEPLEILDFTYLTVAKFTEGGEVQKDAFMAYLSDQSFAIQSSLTGLPLITFELPNADPPVALYPAFTQKESHFVYLT